MKKIISLLIAGTLLGTTMLGCASGGGTSEPASTPESSVSESSVAESSEAPAESTSEASTDENPSTSGGTLVMATEAGFRPYEYYEGTDIVGVDVDIAREIAAEMGMELVVEHMEFGAIIPAVNSGKADFGAAGMSITDERKQQVDFTIEYATSKQVILTKKDSDVKGEADLNGKDVGVQLGTVADLVLSDDYPEVKVRQYNKYMEASNDLINGRLSAIVLDVLPAQELTTMDDSLVILDDALFTDVYAFCVKKENPELLDTINKVMQRLIDEGKIDEFTATHSAS